VGAGGNVFSARNQFRRSSERVKSGEGRQVRDRRQLFPSTGRRPGDSERGLQRCESVAHAIVRCPALPLAPLGV